MARADIAKAEAEVAQSRAALDNAEEDLRNSTIVSPIDGLVLSRDVNVGDAVSSILILGSQATPDHDARGCERSVRAGKSG